MKIEKTIGKEHPLEFYREFTALSGCVDFKNMKSFYIDMGSYIIFDQLEKEELENFFKITKFKIKKYFSNQTKYSNIHSQVICDLNEKNIGRKLVIKNGNIFFNISLTVFYKEIPIKFRNTENIMMIEEIFKDVVDIINDYDITFKRDSNKRKLNKKIIEN
jgi:hypothetical protein